jgi:outer membrane protein TolC
VLGTVMQPITQQYKIGLAIRAEELGREVARERLRAQRQATSNEVRTVYYSLVATQSALEAAREGVKTLQEVQRVAEQYAAVHALLKADSLDVASRLAMQEYQLAVAEDGLATQFEHLNQLLGRDLRTPFRVAEMPEIGEDDLTLEVARQRALANRPELREMRLKAQQAEYDRRIARAAYIPDLSFSVDYLGVQSIEMLPSNAAAAGFLLSWEPFDWGRKRNVIAEKANTLEQAKNGVAETEAQISVEIGMRYRKWREALLLLKADRIDRDAAAEQLRVVTNKFQEQSSLVKDVLQAEARHSEVSYQYQQALSAYFAAEADLKKAMGEE